MNLRNIAALATLAVRVDLSNSTITTGQGQYFPLKNSGVVIGKSYAASLKEAGNPTLEECLKLHIISEVFSQLDANEHLLDSNELSISVAGQAYAIDVSNYVERIKTAQRAARLAILRERVGAEILAEKEQEGLLILTVYSEAPLKDDLAYELADTSSLIAEIESQKIKAFADKDYKSLPLFDAQIEKLQSGHVYDVMLDAGA
jgi:hypothetical protein